MISKERWLEVPDIYIYEDNDEDNFAKYTLSKTSLYILFSNFERHEIGDEGRKI